MNTRTMLAGLICIGRAAAPPPPTVGNITFAGNPQFDADSIANPDPGHWQWLAWPGGRLVLNPSVDDTHIPPPLPADIPLNLGGWVGNNAERWSKLCSIQVCDPGQSAKPATKLETEWFPYKYAFSASYPNGAQLAGEDYFVSGSSLLRHFVVQTAKTGELLLTGAIPDRAQVRWDDQKRALVVIGGDFIYALTFAQSTAPYSALSLTEGPPETDDGKYTLRLKIPEGRSEYAIGLGFAPQSEGTAVAIDRAKAQLLKPILESRSAAKEAIEGLLKRVPAPSNFGFQDDEKHHLSAEQHRRAYYAAWSFLIQDVVDVMPEAHFPFQQVMTGKPSLWHFGEPHAPGMAQWDSLFGIQFLAYLEPDAAWSAFRGFMSLVDITGAIAGESLTARKAQTAWILFSLTHDRNRLLEVYPALQANLLWEEKNPRWIFPGVNDPHQRDLEFAAAWIFDADFMVKICNALGHGDEVAGWRQRQERMADNCQKWFFDNPTGISQYFSTTWGSSNRSQPVETARDGGILSGYLSQALAVNQLSPLIQSRLMDYFTARFKPDQFGLGMRDFKYPDVNLTAYGLLDHHATALARQYIEGVLAESVQVGTFAETIDKTPRSVGVQESLFSAMNIIEFTWLLNNCRMDKGAPSDLGLVPDHKN
jgi:hypothetical protein